MSGFLTRLLAANECGPNVEYKKTKDAKAGASKVYLCPECRDSHDDYTDALACCQPTLETAWVCDSCDAEYGAKERAVACCKETLNEGQRLPQCMVCMYCVSINDVADADDKLEWWIEAAKCCLPVKSDVLTSEDCVQVGELLARGVSWVDAVAQIEAKVREKRKEQACQVH